MTDLTFEALTRRAALTSLGAAGLVFAAPPVIEGKRKARKRKRKRRTGNPGDPAPCIDTCQPQGELCRSAVTQELCPANPEGCEALGDCCTFLETCNTLDFLLCLFTPPD